MIKRLLNIFILVSLIQLNFTESLNAQKFSEYEVKLVYIYQFSKFVTWPELVNNADDKFVIGVYGENPFGGLPEIIFKGKMFKGKEALVKNITTVEEAKNCEMVFVNGVKTFDFFKFRKELGESPVLLIGNNIENFCKIGGMINFTAKQDKYRFEINPSCARKSNINISSKLFSVARIIELDETQF